MPYAGQLDADDRKSKGGEGGAVLPIALLLATACLGSVAWLVFSGEGTGPSTGPPLPDAESLLNDARRAGVELSGVRFGTQEWLGGPSSQGMVATRGLEKDEVVATVPWECTLSDQIARKRSSWAKEALAVDGNRPQPNRTLQGRSVTPGVIGFALFELFVTGKLSLEEGPCDVFLASYARFVREAVAADRQFPQHWDPVSERAPLALLEGTMLGGSGGHLERWRSETAQNYHLLQETLGAEELVRQGASVDVYGHARLAVASRSFPVTIPEVPGQRKGRNYIPPPPIQAFVPLADLLNFDVLAPDKPMLDRRDTSAHAGAFAPAELWKTLDGDKVEVKLTKAIRANKAVFFNYQPKPSWEMLALYGFTLPWVGNMTCFAVAPFKLSAPDLPDVVLEPTRCLREFEELNRLLNAIRWRQLREAGEDESLKVFRCTELRPSVPILTGEAWKSWKGCRQTQTTAAEIKAWQALGDMARDGVKRHEATIGDSAAEAWASRSSWARAAHVLLDELTVYRSIAEQADAVVRKCSGHSERAPGDFPGLSRCVRGAREAQEKIDFNLPGPEGEL